MNKDVISLYKSETGSKPNDLLIESEQVKPKHGGYSVHGLLMKNIPAKFKEYDSEIDIWYLIFPDEEYINWLEEKVLELQRTT